MGYEGGAIHAQLGVTNLGRESPSLSALESGKGATSGGRVVNSVDLPYGDPVQPTDS